MLNSNYYAFLKKVVVIKFSPTWVA